MADNQIPMLGTLQAGASFPAWRPGSLDEINEQEHACVDLSIPQKRFFGWVDYAIHERLSQEQKRLPEPKLSAFWSNAVGEQSADNQGICQ